MRTTISERRSAVCISCSPATFAAAINSTHSTPRQEREEYRACPTEHRVGHRLDRPGEGSGIDDVVEEGEPLDDVMEVPAEQPGQVRSCAVERRRQA